MFDRILTVYDKQMNKIAIFTGDTDGISEAAKNDLACAPTVKLVSGELAELSFQMLASSEKLSEIKNPENLFNINDKWYTSLSESSYVYEDNNGVSVCTITLPEIGALLSRQYHQAYNCSIYCGAKAYFNRYVNDGAEFTIYSSGCFALGNTISNANAWEQVKNWETKGDNGNQLTFAILSQDEYKPTKWEKPPSGVFFRSFSVSGNTATVVIESRAKMNMTKTFPYSSSNQYSLGESPNPSRIESVKVNSTVVTETNSKDKNTVTYNTSDKTVTNYSYNASTGVVTVRYYPAAKETVNGVIIQYKQSDLGAISPGATCTFAYGAEAVDEHTFVILPKANTKYKLTIDGVSYSDSQVIDSRGVIMPRGSGGYAMWAALKNTGWTLGICDVIALDFDASIDYGCFNVESDMKDTLSNIRMIQKLYGGILDWDSKNKILNYRAENYDHYQAYRDGFNEWKGYVFREGKNITERPVITYDNSIITRAYLLGYGNLNVRKVNNGKTYIDNFTYTKDIYEGYLKQELIYDTRDDGGMKQLLYWGKKELEKQSRPRKSVKLSVTDVRTVEGLEHEVFDINDIVKVYYHDESTDTDVTEFQRVVAWEYNAFAMWDCTVELGDKTVNEVELFKLIYNKSINSPGVDGNGNISGGNIDISGSGGNDPNSLPSYIELIAKTSTDNSDAIAGLILDTSATHAQVDLFAYYQKQTDTLLTQAYAGLQFYADEKSAQAIMEANKYTEQTVKDAEGRVNKTITDTRAYLTQYADDKSASAALGAELNSKKYTDGKIEEVTNAQAKFEAYVDKTFATTAQLSSFEQIYYNSYSDLSKKIVAINQAGFITYADAEMASASVIAQQIMNGDIVSQATMEAYVDGEIASIDLSVSSISGGGAEIYMDSYGILRCSSTAIISLDNAGIISIGDDRNTAVYIRGVPVRVMKTTISGVQIHYFGYYDGEEGEAPGADPYILHSWHI